MSKSNYKWLMRESKPATRWLFITITLGILSGLSIIAQAALLAFLIDRVTLHHATLTILHNNLSLFLGIIIFRSTLSFLREQTSFQATKTVKESVRKKIFEHLMRLSPITLAQFKTGALTSSLLEQIEALHGFFSDYFPQMVIAVILPCIILIFVFIQNWITGLILLFTAPLIPLFMALIGMKTAKLNQENFQILSRMSGHFLNMLQGLTTLTLFHRAQAQVTGIEIISNHFREKTMRILRIAFLSSSALELFSTLAIAIIAVYLGLGLLGFIHIGFEHGHIGLRQGLFILLLAPEFFIPLRQLGAFYHARSEAMGAAEELIKIVDTHVDSRRIDTTTPKMTSIHLVFENVTFSYISKIMFDFNLTVARGECVAITGPSGTGKSTLLHLIAKFITPTSGKIIVNDINLCGIDDDHWRKHIALLHQNTRLFYGTIEDNIRIAKPQATYEEITLAAKKSGVLDFTNKLSDGLHTQITEHNGGLSGGQAQRVALARIILKDAPLILLDEPSASLDTKNIEIMIRLLNEWRHHKTIIIATHDPVIIHCAEHVFALDNS